MYHTPSPAHRPVPQNLGTRSQRSPALHILPDGQDHVLKAPVKSGHRLRSRLYPSV